MIRNARRLVGVDANAARLGLSAGLTLADARARHPALVASRPIRPRKAKLLERLADVCARYTPLVALDGADGLMLDVSGVAHLFGGEAGLLAEIEARFEPTGVRARAGPRRYAARRLGARALFEPSASRPPASPARPSPSCSTKCRSPRSGSTTSRRADMARAGLRRIGDLAMRPRAPIAARFGAEVDARLDALNGLDARRDLAALRRARLLRRAALRQPDRASRGGDGDARRLADDLVVLLERRVKGARAAGA